jgi:bla regulator protein blaR1
MTALVAHLWQSTLFVGAIWVATLTLRKNQAQVRYWLWFIASAKFLIPFSLLVALGALVPWRPAAQRADAEWTAVVEQVRPLVTIPAVGEDMALIGNRPNRSYFRAAALILWLCGFVTIAICWMVRWKRMEELRNRATPWSIRDNIESAVPIMSAPGIVEPGVFGILRPVLLLPEDIAERLDRAQLQAILAHEFCHVRRRDNLTSAIHMAVQAVFWFHPLVWWIGVRLIEERERSCDEVVVRSGNLPRVYAEGILNVCKLYLESPLACVAGVTGAHLKRRIARIVANQRAIGLSFAKRIGLALAGTGALLGPVVVGVMHTPLSRAQAFPPRPADTPKFEVASIKPCSPEANRGAGAGPTSPGRLSTGCVALVFEDNLGLIQRAYVRLGDGRPARGFRRIIPIVGGPPWLRSQMFSIVATAEGTPSEAMMNGPMLQLLLEDRFQLKIHREMREGPVYALTLAGAPKFSEFQEGSCVPPVATPSGAPLVEGQRFCHQFIRGGAPLGVDAEGSTVEDFAAMLSLLLDHPVIDRTGLAGKFDLHVNFSPDQATPRAMPGGDLTRPLGVGLPDATSEPTGLPSVFTAIQEQLGLKLAATRGPTEVLVIDHVQRPSEN